MPLAEFLGWDSQDWRDTAGLVGVFFVFFPLLVNGLIVFIIAQVIGERSQNQAYARGEDLDASQG
jgi:phage shock protein PspC (stress-responsive transcriptional regulator)